MARHKRGRRKRPFNLRKVRVARSLSIGALAAGDLIFGTVLVASTNRYRVVSTNVSYSLTDLAALIDDGQEFGLSHSSYTDAEVETCLESSTAIDIINLVEQEQANRLVRPLGYFTGAPGTDGSKSHNDGMPVKTKLNWLIGIGDTLNMWIRNGSDTAYSSGTRLTVIGDIWVKDV